MTEKFVGVIGGSGLYHMDGLTDVEEIRLDTPFGAPSDAYITGRLHGVKMAFLARHGRGHRFTPSEVPYRANVYGMKMLGVSHIISVSAVGSMREDIHPGHVVVVDQFFDRTKDRASTFFGEGLVAHVGFADPVCPVLAEDLYVSAVEAGVPVHRGGTYICMEGPAFSTRAESRIYRQWGVDVIGMTNLPEAKLAREAEIPYATLALATDYDCWHQTEEDVTVDAVVAVLKQNVVNAQKIISQAVPKLRIDPASPAHDALRYAILTHKEGVPAAVRERLHLLVGKYF